MKNKTNYINSLYVLSVCLGLFLSCSKKINVSSINGETMGTTYSIKVVSSDIRLETLKVDIDNLLVGINHKMSTYDNDSELSKLNNGPANTKIKVSDELFNVISKAIEISKKSNSVYDITLGPLINIWGFGPMKVFKKPTEDEINEAKKYIGIDKIQLDITDKTIIKSFKKVYIDLSSIAKGYAVDKVAKLLIDNKIKNFLVEIGGEIVTNGSKGGSPWVLAIERPSSDLTRSEFKKIPLIGKYSLATSGSYRNFIEDGQATYSHTIDAKLGIPIQTNLVSSTVIMKGINCMEADAWSTALMASGDNALNISELNKLNSFLIFTKDSGQDEQGFIQRESSGLLNFFKKLGR